MARQYKYWKCSGCGQTLQGIEQGDGDFISDKEMETQPIARIRAVGCYLCGCPVGDFIEDDHPETDAEYSERLSYDQ